MKQFRPPNRASGIVIVSVLLFTVTNCAVGPDYVRPDLTVADQWAADESSPDSKTSSVPLARWWQNLDDPVLSGLLEAAAASNRDMHLALSRIREARLQRQKSRAAWFPAVDASASVRRSDRSENARVGANAGVEASTELYSAGLDAGWELDLFGGTRRSVEAYQADLAAAVESLNDVMISLLAEVVLNYVDLRTYQSRIDVADRNVAVQEETWQLLDALNRSGMGDPLAVEQSRYNLASSRAKIPDLMVGREAAINRLAVLTAQPVDALRARLVEPRPLPLITADIAVGVPAEVLRRRPDIRRVERQLAAQTARVGVAAAERYPSFSLDGSIGLEALSLGDLFSSATRIWSLGSSIRLPIFSAGAVRTNIKIQQERAKQAIIHYEAAVSAALEEVENALVVYAQEQRKIEELQAAAEAARSAAELAGQCYATGMTDFSSVLDAQRSLLTYEDQLAVSRGAVLSDLVRLYKALGGGWQFYRPAEGDPLSGQKG